jgi:hypothetical protein
MAIWICENTPFSTHPTIHADAVFLVNFNEFLYMVNDDQVADRMTLFHAFENDHDDLVSKLKRIEITYMYQIPRKQSR